MKRRDYKKNSLRDDPCSDIRHKLFKCIESQDYSNNNYNKCIELYNNFYLKCIDSLSPKRISPITGYSL